MSPARGVTSVSSSVRVWAEMVKLSHSVFALPFALMAAFLAGRHLEGGLPHLGQMGLILVCMVAARSVAMTFNRIVDAQMDARNPRTSGRPLPAGRLSHAAAWSMLGLAAVTFGVACLGFHVFFDNRWPMMLSGPVLMYLCGYSYTKRFTRWSHFYLGSAIALSPVATWLAVDPTSVGTPVAFLVIVVTCWIGGFDIIYACQDIEVDQREGLYSLPSRLGPAKALLIARASHVVAVAGLFGVGVMADLGVLYWIGVGLVIVLLIVENAMVRPGQYARINVAFFTVNGIVSIVLALAAIGDVLLARANSTLL